MIFRLSGFLHLSIKILEQCEKKQLYKNLCFLKGQDSALANLQQTYCGKKMTPLQVTQFVN